MSKCEWLTPPVRQSLVMSSVMLVVVSGSGAFAYASVLLPALRDPSSSIRIDLTSASWIASSVGAGTMLGSIFGAISLEVCGRRLTHFFAIACCLLGWVAIYFAQDVPTLIVGRLLSGSNGAYIALGAIMLGEYTSPRYRGVFLVTKTVSVCIGTTLVHILGNYLHWRTVALALMIPNVAAMLIGMMWPESPYWLASQKRFRQCKKSFQWLRGTDEESNRELKVLLTQQKHNCPENAKNSSTQRRVLAVVKKYRRKEFWMSMLILFVAVVLMEVSGRHFFPGYAADIVGEIIGDKTQRAYCTLAIDLIFTISAISSATLIKFMKIRTLLFSSSFVAICMLPPFCICQYMVDIESLSREHQWLPMSFLILFFITVNLGATTLPLMLIGEVIPLGFKGVGSAVIGTGVGLIMQLTLYVIPYLMVSVKIYGMFAVFGCIMLIILIILYYILPETKDKTLLEIENYLINGNYDIKNYLAEEDVEMLDSSTNVKLANSIDFSEKKIAYRKYES